MMDDAHPLGRLHRRFHPSAPHLSVPMMPRIGRMSELATDVTENMEGRFSSVATVTSRPPRYRRVGGTTALDRNLEFILAALPVVCRRCLAQVPGVEVGQ